MPSSTTSRSLRAGMWSASVGVGPSVSEVSPGDRAYAYARLDVIQHGTMADEVVLPVRVVARAPETIDLVHAAAVPLTGLTAMQLLRRLDLHLDETITVHNASGGVGQFAVQLARLAGAQVIGTASAGNHEHLRSLGIEPVEYGDGNGRGCSSAGTARSRRRGRSDRRRPRYLGCATRAQRPRRFDHRCQRRSEQGRGVPLPFGRRARISQIWRT